MSDPDNFLSRWSRRKRDLAETDKDAQRADGTTSPQSPAQVKQDESGAPDSRATRTGEAETPFDFASLPSVESITADTDIRGFFAPGVPAELTRAALRRAWAADPHIRDFVGLEENAWNFNDPESIPGFGKLEMTDELRREVQRIVGNLAPEPRPELEPATPATVPSGQPSEAAQEIASGPAPSEASASDPPQSMAAPAEQKPEPRQHSNELIEHADNDGAAQQRPTRTEDLQVAAKKSHGSALPK